MPGPTPTNRLLCFDAFELDVRSKELRKHGTKLRLQGQPLQVLEILLRRPGELVTREELRDEIWQADTFVDFDHSLHNAIARIREVLGDSADTPRFIETLPRRGYRFMKPVEGVATAPGDANQNVQPSDIQGIRSLAVLPLDDHSGESGHEYFADGMTEALITSLAKIQALRVISRTSAMQYKGAKKSLPQIARELNVEAIIEGSILRSGSRIRIAAQLIHAATDQHLWAESYERDFCDILSLQSEIARQVAHEVRITLTPQEQARLERSRPVNPEAHEQYLMGRHHWNKRTELSVKKALAHFQRAIDIDPTNAQGYAGLADSYNILGYYRVLAPKDAYPKGKAAAQRALTLDETLAEPHASLGVVKRDYEWDWAGAVDEFQLAIELNPGYAEAYHWRSTLYGMLGQIEKALQEKARALSLDPLSVVIRTDVARLYYFRRDYDKALEKYRLALDMDANFASAHVWMAQVYEQKGGFEAAISELEAGCRLDGESAYALSRLAHGYASSGKTADAHKVLNQLKEISAQRYVSPYDLAVVHIALQQNEKAFSWMEKALEDRSIGLGYLRVEPELDSLRPDARFDELIRRVGLN